MIKLVIILIITGYCLAAPSNFGVVNGTDASEGEFPFQASLRYDLSHQCGCTILNNRQILTASHCVCYADSGPKDPTHFSIQYGSVKISETTERSVQVEVIHCHPNYSSLHNDLAVVDLAESLPDDGSWKPVKLAKEFSTSSPNSGTIIGWGSRGADVPMPTILQKLSVNIYADEICKALESVEHVCLGSPFGGSCVGDSGGALVSNDQEQIGLSSFNLNICEISNEKTPNYYVRVSYFYDWIQSQIKN